MSRDEKDSEMEQRLSEGLARLADRAVTSPDALRRILRAGDDERPPLRSTRQRGPRLIAPGLALAAAVLVAVAIVVPKLSQHQGGGSRVQTTTPSPAPTVATASGPQHAAWVDGATLYTGAEGSSATAIGPGSTPQWSPDGKWLAYLVIPTGTSGAYQIRMVRYDGTDDHQVLSAPGIAAFMWSPTSDVIAAVPLRASGSSAGLVVVGAVGAPRYVLGPSTPVDSIMWSQDGLNLAYTGPQGVFTVSVSGGNPTKVAYTPPAGDVVILAGWWPGDRGLLLWPDPPATNEADGLALTAVPLDGGSDQVLGTTLVFLRWLAWSPDGTQLAFVTGTGPSPTSDKSLRLCQPPAMSGHGVPGSASSWSCRTLPQPAGTVSLDPTWAPNSSELAFVRADAAPAAGPYGAFFGSRTLYVASADGSGAAPLAIHAPAGTPGTAVSTGVVLPAWSPNGSQIGYSTGSAVVSVPAAGGLARIVASGLVGSSVDSSESSIGTDYYGKSPWVGAATWSTGPGSAAAEGS